MKYAEFHEHKLEILNRPRKGRGGGIGFIFNPQVLKLTVNNVRKYSSFEVSEALLQGCSELIRLCVVYRSTQNTSKAKYEATKQSKFFDEFSDYLDCLASKSGKPIIAGDFNFHLERHDDVITKQFVSLYEDKGFQQHILEPTHIWAIPRSVNHTFFFFLIILISHIKSEHSRVTKFVLWYCSKPSYSAKTKNLWLSFIVLE